MNDVELRSRLTPEEFSVLREAATERPWSGELLDESRAGLYTCKACGNELFQAGTKFDSGCGWPSFYVPVRPAAVHLLDDDSLGVQRTDDGVGTPTGDRYCMNSLALSFTADED